MPNVCKECPNLKNSYVHGLVTIHWLVSRFCVFVWPDSLSYFFYRRKPGTSGESDVSAGLHVGIVQSFIREHHLSAALHHLRSDRGSTTVPNTAKRNSYLIILRQRISLPSIREGQHLTSTKTYEQLSILSCCRSVPFYPAKKWALILVPALNTSILPPPLLSLTTPQKCR